MLERHNTHDDWVLWTLDALWMRELAHEQRA